MTKIDMDAPAYEEFIAGYPHGLFSVSIDSSRAGDFVLSEFADKHNKPAHYFWTWLGLILTVPVSIALIFVFWVYAVSAFIAGLVIVSAARKSAVQFVLQNMLEDETFYRYVLLHGGAKIERADIAARFERN